MCINVSHSTSNTYPFYLNSIHSFSNIYYIYIYIIIIDNNILYLFYRFQHRNGSDMILKLNENKQNILYLKIE